MMSPPESLSSLAQPLSLLGLSKAPPATPVMWSPLSSRHVDTESTEAGVVMRFSKNARRHEHRDPGPGQSRERGPVRVNTKERKQSSKLLI